MPKRKNIMIIAGEPSGDMRGMELLKELKTLQPDIQMWGIGGDLMQAEGVELIEHVRNLSIIGVWGIIKNLKSIRRHFKDIQKAVIERKPDLAILIDYPGFNLKIAKFLTENNIPVMYYIIPQVWAWGANRTKLLEKYTQKAFTLFKFEEDFLKERGVDSKWTGHPLVDAAPVIKDRTDEKLTIALLPGSRKSEIKGLLPVILGSAREINKKIKEVRYILAKTSAIPEELYAEVLNEYKDLDISFIRNNTFEALNNCDYAIVTSGTATLETALMEKPLVLTYKTTILFYALAKLVMPVPIIGLVNIIAKKEIAPECVQWEATAENISSKLLEIITDPVKNEEMRKELKKVKLALGEKGAARRAAEEIAKVLIEMS